MNTSDSDEVRVVELVSRLLDERLTDAEFAELDASLANDAAARRLYMRWLETDEHLREWARDPRAFDTATGGQAVAASFPGALRGAVWGGYVVTACLTLAVCLATQWFWRSATPQGSSKAGAVMPLGVASMSRDARCEWADGSPRLVRGQPVIVARYELSRGAAELVFDGGVRVIFEGPARFEPRSNRAATLYSGKAVVHGGDDSVSFDLRTPRASLLDIGTEYGVVVRDGVEEVHVFEGEVWRQAGERLDVIADGQALRFGQGPERSAESISLARAKFVTEVAVLPPPISPSAHSRRAVDLFQELAMTRERRLGSPRSSGWRGDWEIDGRFAGSFAQEEAGALDCESDGSLCRQMARGVDLSKDDECFFSVRFSTSPPNDAMSQGLLFVLRSADDVSPPRRMVVKAGPRDARLMIQADERTLRRGATLDFAELGEFLLIGRLATRAARNDSLSACVSRGDASSISPPETWPLVVEDDIDAGQLDAVGLPPQAGTTVRALRIGGELADVFDGDTSPPHVRRVE